MTSEGFGRLLLDDLIIEDERSFRHVGLYADLKEILRRDRYSFRILPQIGSWDRALFLNLTFWGADAGGDVLVEPQVPADVVAHVGWHRLAANALRSSPGARPSVASLFLGEAIASAFDLYLVGRLLGHSPKSTFLATQVPAMAEAAQGAELGAAGFEGLLGDVARDPAAAFASLRELLSEATAGLFACTDAEAALTTLELLASHRFGALLHRYELANWLLYARAYGDPAPCAKTQQVDAALREARDPLEWLTEHWVQPALAPS